MIKGNVSFNGLHFTGTYRCLTVYLYVSVRMWRANGNPNPCTDLDKILQAHPHQPRFWYSLDPDPLPPWPGWPETLKAEERFSKTVYKTKDVQQVAN